MGISKARKRFRIFLGILFLLSFCFFSISSYLYISVKQRKIKLLDIAPTLFAIDIFTYKAKAYLQDENGKYDTATELCRKGFSSFLYTNGCYDILDELSKDGHAPSKFSKANLILLSWPITEEQKNEAYALYKESARAGYEPAIEKLALLESESQ